MDWSPQDAERARKEGWVYTNGYIRRYFDSNNSGRFNSVEGVVQFIFERAKTSEWHRNIYFHLPWTYADTHIAAYDGWQLYLSHGKPYSNPDGIYPPTNFTVDESLRERVIAQATNGDLICAKALTILAKRRLLNGNGQNY